MARGVIGKLPVVYDPGTRRVVVENSAEFVETQIRQKLDLFPAHAGVIPANLDRGRSTKSFPRIRGAYQKTPRKVLRERLKKHP